MHRSTLLLLSLVLARLVFGQDFEEAMTIKALDNLSKQCPKTLLISGNGCFSKREVSVTISKNNDEYFYTIWTSVWNSDDKKRYKYYRKRKASTEQLISFLQLESEYIVLKRKQDSLGSTVFSCNDQYYEYAVLGKGEKAKTVSDSECEINGLDWLIKIFAVKL